MGDTDLPGAVKGKGGLRTQVPVEAALVTRPWGCGLAGETWARANEVEREDRGNSPWEGRMAGRRLANSRN